MRSNSIVGATESLRLGLSPIFGGGPSKAFAGYVQSGRQDEPAPRRSALSGSLESVTWSSSGSQGFVTAGSAYSRLLQVPPLNSFNNHLMIFLQCPDATLVAGFRKWQEARSPLPALMPWRAKGSCHRPEPYWVQ